MKRLFKGSIADDPHFEDDNLCFTFGWFDTMGWTGEKCFYYYDAVVKCDKNHTFKRGDKVEIYGEYVLGCTFRPVLYGDAIYDKNIYELG